MPIYEYRCPKGHEFEILQRMDDPPPEACEVCGAKPVERVFRPVPIFFKGSGFYTTDYGKGKKRKVESAGSDGAKSDGDSSKSTDKPAEKKAKTADT
jgi:putative FmdB family regulatory protein